MKSRIFIRTGTESYGKETRTVHKKIFNDAKKKTRRLNLNSQLKG